MPFKSAELKAAAEEMWELGVPISARRAAQLFRVGELLTLVMLAQQLWANVQRQQQELSTAQDNLRYWQDRADALRRQLARLEDDRYDLTQQIDRMEWVLSKLYELEDLAGQYENAVDARDAYDPYTAWWFWWDSQVRDLDRRIEDLRWDIYWDYYISSWCAHRESCVRGAIWDVRDQIWDLERELDYTESQITTTRGQLAQANQNVSYWQSRVREEQADLAAAEAQWQSFKAQF